MMLLIGVEPTLSALSVRCTAIMLQKHMKMVGLEPTLSLIFSQVHSQLCYIFSWEGQDSNLHPLASKASIHPLDYLPLWIWRRKDSNPQPPACKTGALPLSYIPMKLLGGFEPPLPGSKPGVLDRWTTEV